MYNMATPSSKATSAKKTPSNSASKRTPQPNSSAKKAAEDSFVFDGVFKLLKEPAATKAEHAVRSRVLVSPDDFARLDEAAWCIVIFGSEDAQTLICSLSTLGSLKRGTCMVSQEVLDVIGNADRIIVKPTDETELRVAVEVTLSTTDHWTHATCTYVAARLSGSVVSKDTRIGISLGGLLRTLKIVDVDQASPQGRITRRTRIRTLGPEQPVNQNNQIPFAGLDNEFSRLTAMVDETFKTDRGSALFKPVRGALVFGPSGTGKTLLANKLLDAMKCGVIRITDEDTACDRIREAFAPSLDQRRILFIDNLELLLKQNRSIVSALLTGTDSKDSRTFLLACASNPDDLDAALRRPGRFDDEIELGPPVSSNRISILKAHLSRFDHRLDDEAIRTVAETLHGFTGGDLARVATEAACLALDHGQDYIFINHLKQAAKKVHPSCLTEVQVQVPEVKWDQIGGMEQAKRAIKECVELPLKHPEAFIRLGISPPQGVLLYGPPGCSKTLLAKAVATESDMNFIAVKGPELLSKWVGDSEKAVRATFRRAKQSRPCVVFFDEIDALASSRGDGSSSSSSVSHRVTSQLLQELDGVESRSGIIVLCATNRPDLLDPALLRPGRIDRIVYVPPPDLAARLEILRINMKAIPHNFTDEALLEVATDGFSGAETAAICKEAALKALEKGQTCVSLDDLKAAAAKVSPQITRAVLAFYEDFAARHRM